MSQAEAAGGTSDLVSWEDLAQLKTPIIIGVSLSALQAFCGINIITRCASVPSRAKRAACEPATKRFDQVTTRNTSHTRFRRCQDQRDTPYFVVLLDLSIDRRRLCFLRHRRHRRAPPPLVAVVTTFSPCGLIESIDLTDGERFVRILSFP